jgi:hypothetical protein
LKIAFALLALLFYRWDIGHRYTGSGYPKNYVVIATKPASVPMPAARA